MPALLCELANVSCAKAVDILLGRYGGSDGILIDVLRKWQLNQDAMDTGVVIQDMELGKELRLGNAFVVLQELAADFRLG
jgi:hypothetical protein